MIPIHRSLTCLLSLLAWIPSVSVSYSQTPDYRLSYSIQDGAVTITGFKDLTIANLDIPETIEGLPVRTIAEKAFHADIDLLRVSIPANVTDIQTTAFANCTNLLGIEVADGNSQYSSVDGVLYNKGQTELIQFKTAHQGSFVIPSTVQSIAHSAFSLSNNLASVSFPEGLTSIGEEAFNGCSMLIELELPDSLLGIGQKAFNSCTNLMHVKIPANVAFIGDGPFAYCPGLLEIEVDSANPNYSSTSGYLFSGDRSELIQAVGGQGGSYVVPSTVHTIRSFAFHGCDDLLLIAIPSSVTSMGEGVFSSCYLLSKIEVQPTNTAFASVDGVLLSIDRTQLLRYPPRKNEGLDYIIPNTVTTITSDAFRSSRIASITIPDSVTSIGDYAFRDCNNLTSVVIPNSVTSIGKYAFYSCDELINVTLSNNLVSLGNRAFSYCRKMLGLSLPASLTSIGERVFTYCKAMDSINVDPANPNYKSVSGVLFSKDGSELIQYPGSMAGPYTIPSSVFTVSEGAFYDCNSIPSVSIPASVTDLGKTPFLSCRNLTSIDVDMFNNNYSSLEGVLLSEDRTQLIQYPQARAGDYIVRNIVEFIGPYAFNDCDGLTSITIPAATQIGAYAFFGSDDITTITLNDPLTAIGYKAFAGCDTLTSVSIPASVKSIGELALSDCIKLSQISVHPDNPWYASQDDALFNKSKTLLIRYPQWKQGPFAVPDTVITLSEYAFESCTGLSAVTLSGNLETIGSSAFIGCTFYEIRLTDKLICIGPNAFYDNRLLQSVVIPSNVRSIGRGAFYQCYSLTYAIIPKGPTKIGESAFSYCEKLSQVTIPDTVEYIGEFAFSRCPVLENVYFHGDVPVIPSGPELFGFYTIGVTSYYIEGNIGWEDTFSGKPASPFFPSPWYQATLYSSGWQYLNWFGLFVNYNNGWLYHQSLGWMYADWVSLDGFYLYEPYTPSWRWSSELVFPYVYEFGPTNTWIRISS